jgi:hypothetical protein
VIKTILMILAEELVGLLLVAVTKKVTKKRRRSW